MESKEHLTSTKPFPSRRQMDTRCRKEVHIPETKLRNKTFKSKARQIWMANVFAKQRTIGSTMKTEEDDDNRAKKDTDKLSDSISSRPPSVKRKGTPDIFPMSSEMKRTLLMLGNLDLLPEDERLQQRALKDTEKKTSVRNSFRHKTRQKIINPQRFLRGMRSNVSAKESVTKEREIGSENGTGDKIDLHDDNLEEASDEEKKSHGGIKKVDENDGNQDNAIDDEKPRESDNKSRTISAKKRPLNSKQLWRTSYRKYQSVNMFANYPAKPNYANGINLKRSNQIHLSETRQQGTQPRAHGRRVVSDARLSGFKRSAIDRDSEEQQNQTLSPEEQRTVEDIITDIQLRCSRWFEFRRRVLNQKSTVQI